MVRGIAVLVLILLAFLCSGQRASKPVKPLTLFTIRDNPVSTTEFIYLFKKNHPSKPEDFTEPKINDYLELFINFKLIVTEARQRGMDTTAAFKKEFKSYKDELKKPYLAEADEIDRLTKEAYQHLTEDVRASHILISLKPDATPADTLLAYKRIMEIRDKAIAGEDFGKLAREFSEDPSAKANDGDLGFFTGLQMVYAFEQAAYGTPVGEISQPARTRFGYHLIKTVDRQPAHGEVEVSHILLRLDNGNESKVKNTIFEIYDQLKEGRNWDELCKEYSQDESTKNNGGRLRAFGVGALASVPEFEKIAFSLQQPGEISDPFQSSIGWHIIRLEKKTPVPSFKELESSLKRKISRDERLQISQTSLLNKRKKEFGLEETELRNVIFSLADSSLVNGRWQYKSKEEITNQALFTIQAKPVLLSEFIQYVKENQRPSALSPQVYMMQLYDKFVSEKLSEQEEEVLQEQHPELRSLINEYSEGILLFAIKEKEVWNKASEDSVGQRKFYEQQASRYQAGDRVKARLFSTPDKIILEEMRNKIQKGDTLSATDLKKFKGVQNFRSYEKGENKIIDKITWSIGIHETEADGIYYLVEVSNLLEPGVKNFQDARAQVISDYQDHLEKAWIAQLKTKYPVTVNSKGKKWVMAELKKK